jgi:purine-binding chemotaxis protein CheW
MAGSGQYLTFHLAGEEYGLDILKVQEIRGWTQVTRIPHTPPHVQGVLNLRGTIVPIIDLRKRFDLEKVDYTRITVVIVLSVTDLAGRRVIGIVVDGVSGVLDVTLETIKPAPNFGSVEAGVM